MRTEHRNKAAEPIRLLFIICSFLFSTTWISCADTDMEQLQMQQPETLAAYGYLQRYDVLKAYSDQVGVAIDAQTLADRGMEYRIAVSNFAWLMPARVFSHAQVVKANGSLDATAIAAMKQLAAQHDMQIVSTPLVWHRQQNTTYLNACLEPNVIRPEGDEGGYCLKMTNTAISPTAASAQVAYTFAKTPQVEPGISYKLKMMVRGTAEGKVQVQTWANGKGSRFAPDIAVTKEWTRVETINTMAAGIKGLTAILFNLGQYVGTLYVDDIEIVEWNTTRQREIGKNLNTVNTHLDDAEQTTASIAVQTDADNTLEDVGCSLLGEGYDPLATYVEKTEGEKQEILTAEMLRYITGVIEAGADRVREWIVVGEPLAQADDDATSFYWQSHLGDDYALAAYQQAARLTDGKLYIGAGAIETAAEAKALADFIARMEQRGGRIDGIAVTIQADTQSPADYAAMLQALAATGKLVRLVDVQVAIGDVPTTDATEEQLQQQAALLTTVLQAYTAQVPAAQRAGIVWHQLMDGQQPLGLWAGDYSRKHVYGSLAGQLSGK